MLKNSSLEYMNEMYEKYKQHFEGSFHSALWHLFVDWSHDKLHAFVQNYKEGGITLGIATANEQGYTPTMVYFKNGTTYKQAAEILDAMNEDIFGHNHESAMQITTSSMQGKGVNHKSKFQVYITWKVEAVIDIEAESEEAALTEAKNIDLPEGAIAEDSFEASIYDPESD